MLNTINLTAKGYDLVFKTDPMVFSPYGLDRGTAALLSVVAISTHDRVLDLGCGYGVVGIMAAQIVGEDQVVLVDVDPVAVKLAQENARLNHVPKLAVYQSDGFKDIKETN